MNYTKITFFMLVVALSFHIGFSISNYERGNAQKEQGQKEQGQKIDETVDEEYNLLLIPYFPQEEISMILKAGKRNNLNTEQLAILFAIRKSENGRAGREFGIMNPKANTFDLQAGWCAATIYKNQERWAMAGKPDDFITFLGNRYCPTSGDITPMEQKLNKHWIPNVKYWVHKITGKK